MEVELRVETSAQPLAVLERGGMLTRTSLSLPASLEAEQYEQIGRALASMKETVQWAVGDWLAFGERRYGEEAYQLQEASGLSEESRAQYVRVSTRVEPHRRVAELSWTHHRVLSAYDPVIQEHWLLRCVNEGLSVAALREELKAAKVSKEYEKHKQKPYVVEVVADAAEHVFSSASLSEDGTFRVPYDEMAALAAALGEDLP